MDKRLWLAGGAGILAMAGVAIAQQPMTDRPDRNADMTRQQVIDRVDARFQTLDANRDGRFTLEESRAEREARRAQRIDRMFERLDSNRDGSITRAEMAEARPMRMGRRMGGRMGGRGPGPQAGGPGGPGAPEMGPPPPGGPRGRGMRGMGGRMFGEQGFVTRDQMRERALARFDRVDADRNGTVTPAERQAAREQMRARRQNGA